MGIKIRKSAIHNLLPLFWLITASSCEKKATDKLLFTSNSKKIEDETHHFGEDLRFEVTARKVAFDSITLEINDKKTINGNALRLDSSFAHYGINTLESSIFYEGGKRSTRKLTFTMLPAKAPTQGSYKIIKTFPHDKNYFTEGLSFQDGFVYESTGGKGKSKLVRYALNATRPEAEAKLSKKYFGEGIALVGDSIYQLTYESRKVLIYDRQNLKRKGELDYPPMLSEGWGMHYQKPYLLVSDGSSNIYFFDKRLNLKHKIQVTTDRALVKNINELEVFEGKIYANVWQRPIILVIDMDTGVVKSEINLRDLMTKHKRTGVLNGIAAYGRHLLITGKNWGELFEISIQLQT